MRLRTALVGPRFVPFGRPAENMQLAFGRMPREKSNISYDTDKTFELKLGTVCIRQRVNASLLPSEVPPQFVKAGRAETKRMAT